MIKAQITPSPPSLPQKNTSRKNVAQLITVLVQEGISAITHWTGLSSNQKTNTFDDEHLPGHHTLAGQPTPPQK